MNKITATVRKSPEYIAKDRSQSRYALPQDFCAIFDAEMNGLYGLALLLIGDHEVAHRTFVEALEDCRSGPDVFRGWALSWARRAIIKRAILLADFGSDAEAPRAAREAVSDELNGMAAAVVLLNRLERFVYVISVLEGYSLRECALLLNRSGADVEKARIRAMEAMAQMAADLVPETSFSSMEHGNSPLEFIHTH